MLFLIDYENVGNAGMRGCEYLDDKDRVIIFYSDNRKYMERRLIEAIDSSGCTFEVCKLCKIGKNGLDFYIASRLGELIGDGYEGISVIVSRDNGYSAVRDYWMKRAPHRRRVFVSYTIEDGILDVKEKNVRTRELSEAKDTVRIDQFYHAYAERLRVKAVLEKLFAGTEYEDLTDEILGLIQGGENSPKLIYLNSLRHFGRKGGLEIYNRLKACEEL